MANDQVTFRYRVGVTKHMTTCTLPAAEFIRRFVQHVLPKGFVKVRYFGLFSPGKRRLLAQVRARLAMAEVEDAAPATSAAVEPDMPVVVRCPACGTRMERTEVLLPVSRSPPRTSG